MRGDRLHPLRQPPLSANGGVTGCAGTDDTGDHLARVEAHPQLQRDAVAVLDFWCEGLDFLLNSKCGQTSPQRMVLQSIRRPEDRHDTVAGEFVDGAAVV